MFSSDIGKARGALLFMTVIWGSTFVANQTALESVSTSVLVVLRFGLAALSLAVLRPAVLREMPKVFVRVLPLSLSTMAGFVLQIGGLGDTTPARSAFITALFVMVVPILESIRDRRLPSPRVVCAVFVAMLGVATLFSPGAGAWTRGDTMTMLSTLAFAVYILEVDRLGKVIDPYTLTFTQFLGAAIFASPFIALETPRLVMSPTFAFLLAYLVLICSMLAILVSAKYQHFVSPTEAAIIYTLEPIIATALSIGLGREMFTWRFIVGGAFVVIATLLVSLQTPGQKKEERTKEIKKIGSDSDLGQSDPV